MISHDSISENRSSDFFTKSSVAWTLREYLSELDILSNLSLLSVILNLLLIFL